MDVGERPGELLVDIALAGFAVMFAFAVAVGLIVWVFA